MKKIYSAIFWIANTITLACIAITATFIINAKATDDASMKNVNAYDEMIPQNIDDSVANTEPVEPEITETTVTLCATGDNLAHTTVYNKCLTENGTYDFTGIYENIKPLISSYDLAVINQETVLITDPKLISSYPCFGTPAEMASAIVDTGFDIVLQATNHIMDKKIAGVESTLNVWQHYPDMTVLGIHADETDANNIDIIEKNGIKFAMFNYTYGTNGIPIPSDYVYMIDTLDDKDKLITDIQAAENQVDFTVCFLHIGDEYVYTPTAYQKSCIDEVIDAGADVIICAHPHVIEPYEWVTTENGNKGLVYYSCGNFVSGQDKLPRILGGIATVEFKKTSDGICSIENFDFIPIVTHRTRGNDGDTKVYLLQDYTDDLAAQHSISGITVQKLWDLWNSVCLSQ